MTGAGGARAHPPIVLGALAGGMVAGRAETVLGCLAVATAGALASGARPDARALGRLFAVAAFAFALNLWLVRGTPWPAASFGPLHATREGAALGAIMAGRLVTAAAAIAALRRLWPGERAAEEVTQLLMPLRRLGVPVLEARAVFALALRFAPLVAEETRRIARQQDLRAGRPAALPGERVQRWRARLVPALASALERAEAVALALEARFDRVRPLPASAPAPWASVAAGWLLAGGAALWRAR